MRSLPYIFILTLILGCSRAVNPRLAAISELVSDYPDSALVLLDSIPEASLSVADHHFRDFLHLKASGKIGIRQTSDSVILSLLDYYKDTELYPEVLYYGGRVYSDLGDLPTALSYFQQSLDRLPENTSDIDLKADILNQSGRLLIRLRLFKETIPCFEYSKMLHPDTVRSYFLNYNRIVEQQYSENEQELALLQQSVYNYQFHERERNKAMYERNCMFNIILITLLISLSLSVVVLYYKYRNKRLILRLHRSIEIIRNLNESNNNQSKSGHTYNCDETLRDFSKSANELREELKHKLEILEQSIPRKKSGLYVFTSSNVYQQLLNKIDSDKFLNDSDPLWAEVENLILAEYPLFKERLIMLSENGIKDYEYRTALLVKIGLTASQIGQLLCISENAVISRRKQICKKIMDEKLSAKEATFIISSL